MLFTDVLMCPKRARSCFSESVFGYGDSFAVLKRENNEKELLLSVLIQHFVQQPLFYTYNQYRGDQTTTHFARMYKLWPSHSLCLRGFAYRDAICSRNTFASSAPPQDLKLSDTLSAHSLYCGSSNTFINVLSMSSSDIDFSLTPAPSSSVRLATAFCSGV